MYYSIMLGCLTLHSVDRVRARVFLKVGADFV